MRLRVEARGEESGQRVTLIRDLVMRRWKIVRWGSTVRLGVEMSVLHVSWCNYRGRILLLSPRSGRSSLPSLLPLPVVSRPGEEVTENLIKFYFHRFIDSWLSQLFILYKTEISCWQRPRYLAGGRVTKVWQSVWRGYWRVLDAVKIIVNQFKKVLCSYLAVPYWRTTDLSILLSSPDIHHSGPSCSLVHCPTSRTACVGFAKYWD